MKELAFNISLFFYFIASLKHILYLVLRRRFLYLVANWTVGIGFVAQFIGLILRSAETGHGPYTSIYEYSLFLSWAIILSYFFVEFKYRFKDLGVFVVPLAFFMMLYASSLPQESNPAESSSMKFWLTIHRTLSMLGLGAFAIAFAASIMYLVQEKLLKTKKIGSLFQRLPSLEVLDNVMHLIITVGFPIFTIGFITGSIWIGKTKGSFFSWDVQKTLPLLITWFIYGSLFIGRIVAGWRRKKAAVISIVGFFSVVVTYILHAY